MARELTSIYKKHSLSVAILSLLSMGVLDLLAARAYAVPTGGNVVAGNVELPKNAPDKNYYKINQHSNKAIIEWQDFSIKAKEHVHIQTPTAAASTLNRVVGHNLSNIAGKLTSTGKVILINPNGIVFHKGAQVDVAGLIASTLNIQNQDYLKEQFTFKQMPGYEYGHIINHGQITTATGGAVALIAPYVKNTGVLVASMGSVVMASATHVTADFTGDGLISFTIQQGVKAIDEQGNPLTVGIDQMGNLIADGGQVYMGTHVAGDTLSHVINMEGVIQADTMQFAQGEVILDGGQVGTVAVAGDISVTGAEKSEIGGRVQITGDIVHLTDAANIDVSGESGGGEAYIGGDYRGTGDIPTATMTLVDSGATINADAVSYGNGGKVIIWADDVTGYYGFVSSRGGIFGGNGGFAEISGKRYLAYRGTIDMSAPLGFNGTVLFDPYDITISSGTSSNISGTGGDPNTFDPTGTAILNITDLTTALASADVIVTTGSDGSDNGDITVTSSFSWGSTNDLTLTAARHVIVNDSQTITSSGGGDLTLRADNDGDGVGDVQLNGVSGTRLNVSGGGNLYTFYNPASFGTPDIETARISFTSSGGSVNNNYQLINNTTKLTALQANSGFWGDDFALSANLDMDGVTAVPIGSISTNFSGDFDGQDFTISNLTINGGSNDIRIGMFAITDGSTIKNLTLNNIMLSNTYVPPRGGSSNGITGGLVASTTSSSATNITNVTINGGTITSTQPNVGGLIALSLSPDAVISNSHTNVMINSTGNTAAGLVAYLFSGGTVKNSSAHGDVTGTFIIGGLVGQNSGHIINSYATGNVTGTGDSVAGLAARGNSGSSIQDSYATGNVSGGTHTGGLMGILSSDATLVNVYATGNVTATGDKVGGLIGDVQDSTATFFLQNGYALGRVSGSSDVGGLVGRYFNSSSNASNAYWDTETSGILIGVGVGSPTGISSKTSTELQNTDTLATLFGGGQNSWGRVDGTSYPYLTDIYTTTPQVVSGSVTSINKGDLIKFATNGDIVGSANRYDNDTFYTTLNVGNTVGNGETLLAYVDNGSIDSNALYTNDSSAHITSGLTFTSDTVTYAGASNSDQSGMATVLGSLSDSDLLYSASGNNITVDSNINFVTAGSNSYSLNGNLTTQGTGMQTYTGVTTLSADSSLTGTTINFASTLNGRQALTITGNANFDGILGGSTALSSLSVSGTSNIANNITATGAQTYTGAVTLSGNTTLTGTTANFSSTLTGGNNNLTLAFSDSATFTGVASGLGAVVVNGAPMIDLQDTFGVSSYQQTNGGSFEAKDLSASGKVNLNIADLVGGIGSVPNQITAGDIVIFVDNAYTASNINYNVTVANVLLMGGKTSGSLIGTAGGLSDLTNVSSSAGSIGTYVFNGKVIGSNDAILIPIDPSRLNKDITVEEMIQRRNTMLENSKLNLDMASLKNDDKESRTVSKMIISKPDEADID